MSGDTEMKPSLALGRDGHEVGKHSRSVKEQIRGAMTGRYHDSQRPRFHGLEEMENVMTRRDFGPLAGIRVLDLGVNIAGPFGATLLGEFGAEVIKIELPETGDTMRHMVPLYENKSLSWVVLGRNKKSITLDIRKSKGQEILKSLVNVSDVLVESFRPGTMEKWGLGLDQLHEINPGLIMIRATGFGQSGPYKDRGGYDRVGAAMGGMTYLTGFPDSPPVRVGLNICDQITGLFNALGALLALYHRDRRSDGKGNKGQSVDISLYESIFRLLESVVADYDKLGLIRERVGNANEIVAPAENFETKDGKWVVFVVTSNKLFHRFLVTIGHAELIDDLRFKSNPQRVKNRDALHRLSVDWFKNKTFSEINEIFLKEGLPFGPVYNIKDIFEDPHYRARHNIIQVDDPIIGPVKMQNVTPRLSLTPGRVVTSGPELGQHNTEIYGKLLGLTGEDLDAFKKEGII